MINEIAHRVILACLFLMFAASTNAQLSSEDLITQSKSGSEILFVDTSDMLKKETNRAIEATIHDFLYLDVSVDFTWDSIKFVRYLRPEDQTFAIVTWVVPLADRQFLYAGFIQKFITKKGSISAIDTVFLLNPSIEEVEVRKSYPPGNWPSAVYNEILPKDKNTQFYTLFGWVGKPFGLAGKTIETISFDTAGAPVFGVPAFEKKDGSLVNRVAFEYTSEIPFHLAYEQQRFPGEKRRTEWMIVFNRIGGNTPGMGRMFRGPVPSYEFFDAYAMIGGRWVLFEDVKPTVDTRGVDDSRPGEMGLSPRK